jgi:hypothetical protein
MSHTCSLHIACNDCVLKCLVLLLLLCFGTLPSISLLQALAEAAAVEGELLAAAQQCSAGAARREASRQQTEAEVARLTSVRCALCSAAVGADLLICLLNVFNATSEPVQDLGVVATQ